MINRTFSVRRLPVLLAAVVLVFAACTPSAESAATQTAQKATPTATQYALPQTHLEITYTGASGYLLSAGGRRVMVDGISTWTPGIVSRAIQAAASPWDTVDLFLVTQHNTASFAHVFAGNFMVDHPETLMIGTAETEAVFREFHPGYEGYQDRILVINPLPQEKQELYHEGIRIEVFSLDFRNVPHMVLGYLIHLGDWTILHTSFGFDLGTNYVNDTQIDVAFIAPGYFLGDGFNPPPPGNVEEILAIVNAEHYIPMGFIPYDTSNGSVLEALAEAYTDMILLSEPLDTVVIE